MKKEDNSIEEKDEGRKVIKKRKWYQSSGSLILLMGIICLVLAGGFISFHWIYEHSNSYRVSTNKKIEDKEIKDKDIKDSSIKLLDDLANNFDYVIYILEGNVFCGDSDFDSIIPASEIPTATSDFVLSTQFHSYDELKAYISHYMSDSLFMTHYSDKKYYYEIDNKLYCSNVKFDNFHQYNPSKTEFNIIQETSDLVVADVKFVLDPVYQDDNLIHVGSSYQSTVTFQKKNDEWILDGIIVDDCKCLDSDRGFCDSSKQCKKTDTFASRYGKKELIQSIQNSDTSIK